MASFALKYQTSVPVLIFYEIIVLVIYYSTTRELNKSMHGI